LCSARARAGAPALRGWAFLCDIFGEKLCVLQALLAR